MPPILDLSPTQRPPAAANGSPRLPQQAFPRMKFPKSKRDPSSDSLIHSFIHPISFQLHFTIFKINTDYNNRSSDCQSLTLLKIHTWFPNLSILQYDNSYIHILIPHPTTPSLYYHPPFNSIHLQCSCLTTLMLNYITVLDSSRFTFPIRSSTYARLSHLTKLYCSRKIVCSNQDENCKLRLILIPVA